MKKVLLTLAKWFHVDLTIEKYVEVEKIVHKRNAYDKFVSKFFWIGMALRLTVMDTQLTVVNWHGYLNAVEKTF